MQDNKKTISGTDPGLPGELTTKGSNPVSGIRYPVSGDRYPVSGNRRVLKKDEYNEKISYTLAGEWIILCNFIKNRSKCMASNSSILT